MNHILDEPRFAYISTTHEAFEQTFDNEITRLGYTHGDVIGDGY